jgi:hypothetical protein
VVQPTNHLARARAYLEAGREDLAEYYARRATEANEQNVDAFLLLGILLERRGDTNGAIRALARASALNPENGLARERLASALRAGYPTGIDEGLLRSLPGEARWGELILRDPRLGLPAPQVRRWMTLTTSIGNDGTPVRDPKFGRPYSRACYAYALQESFPRWFRVATVRFQSVADAALAARVAALVSQLFWVRRAYWSDSPDFPRPLEAPIWLAREGRAGGEEWQGQVYLYEVGRERTPEEWVREVTHEYGHLALPGAPYYTEPQPKANGYQAERLLPKWLLENRAVVWDGRVDVGRYAARRVSPSRERFLAAGPRSPLLRRRDRDGMEYFIGMALAWEATHGPRLLRAAFDRAQGQGAERLLRGCQAALEALDPPRFEIASDAFLPDRRVTLSDRGAAWLFLPVGRWSVALEGPESPPVDARWDDRRLHAQTSGARTIFTIRQVRAGWHRLELASGRAGLKRLEFVRSSRG